MSMINGQRIVGDNKVSEVAKYIINYCHERKIYITNLKLQKLLYFCEVSYLLGTEGKSSCFSETIEAWAYGPVVYSVYQDYKIYGSGEIPILNFQNEIKLVNQKYIDDALDSLAKKSAFYLVDLSHAQDPWINAYKSDRDISKEAIYNYFCG